MRVSPRVLSPTSEIRSLFSTGGLATPKTLRDLPPTGSQPSRAEGGLAPVDFSCSARRFLVAADDEEGTSLRAVQFARNCGRVADGSLATTDFIKYRARDNAQRMTERGRPYLTRALGVLSLRVCHAKWWVALYRAPVYQAARAIGLISRYTGA